MSGYAGHHRPRAHRALPTLRRPLLAVAGAAVIATTAATGHSLDGQSARAGQVDLSVAPDALMTWGVPTHAQHVESANEAGRSAAARGHQGVAVDARARAAAAAVRARKAAALAQGRRDAAARSARSQARVALPPKAPASAAPQSTAPQSTAQAMLGQFGWSSSQFGCLTALWDKESRWKVHADNPASSAYGIPQALPGSRMASAGPDWRNNAATQIRWGLGYIKSRYGSPCSAWGHSRTHNWY